MSQQLYQPAPRPAQPAPQPLALRPADAARAIGVSPRTLWAMTKRGEIPHATIGALTVYPVGALTAWLASRTDAPQPAPTGGDA